MHKNFADQTIITARFLFLPEPINGVKFKTIKIDIHQGIIEIVDEEIHYDFQLNNTTQHVIAETDTDEVFEKVQMGFENQLVYTVN